MSTWTYPGKQMEPSLDVAFVISLDGLLYGSSGQTAGNKGMVHGSLGDREVSKSY